MADRFTCAPIICHIACACARYVAGHLPSALLQEAYTEFPAHHWSNFLGPCYYKKGTPMPGPPGPPPGPAPSPSGKACLNCSVVEKDVHYPGEDISKLKTTSVPGCCEACQKQAGCGGFSYDTQTRA